MSTAEHRPCRWSAKLVRHSADGDAVFKMTAPYHRTVASYDFFNDYRGYFIVSFEFRRPESRHWSNVRASSKVSVQQSLLRGINRCVSRSVTGISRDIVHYSYCIGTVVSHLASRRGLCLSIGIDQLRFRRTVRCCQLVKLRVIYSMAFIVSFALEGIFVADFFCLPLGKITNC